MATGADEWTDLGSESVLLCSVIGCSWGHNIRIAPDAPEVEVRYLRGRQESELKKHLSEHVRTAEVIDGPLKGARVAYEGNEPRPHVDVTVPSSATRAELGDYRSYGMPSYPLRLYRFTIADPSGKPIGYVFSTSNAYLDPEVFRTIKFDDWVYADPR